MTIWGFYGLKTYSGEVGIRPLRDVKSVSEVEAYAWPDPGWFDYGIVAPAHAAKEGTDAASDIFVPVARWVEDTADYAHIIGDFNPVFGRICDLCGFEVALVKMATEPDLVRAMVDRITDFYEAYYRGIAEASQGHVDILAFGDDFASQNHMLINPQLWRHYFKASWERLFAVAHEYGMKAQFHACGAIRPVIGDLVDAGMDILEVVQINLKGMDAVELKQEFGKVLTFHGTVDVQEVLPRCTEEGVRAEVRRLINIFGPGGRYILSSSHLLRQDVPPENVAAMYDEARSYRP
jgi:uroporphyrinogen decarboxylase